VLQDVDAFGDLAETVDQIKEGLVGAGSVGHGLGDGSPTPMGLDSLGVPTDDHRSMLATSGFPTGRPRSGLFKLSGAA